jgi:hypothetical protein
MVLDVFDIKLYRGWGIAGNKCYDGRARAMQVHLVAKAPIHFGQSQRT